MKALENGVAHLVERDAKLRPLVRRYSHTITISPSPGFDSLARVIVGQQLSSYTARSIFSRVRAACGTAKLTPGAILRTDVLRLRQAGVSQAKVNSLIEVAKTVTENRRFFRDVSSLSDIDALQLLTSLKGVGPWTANIYLMFSEGRLDLYPYGDGSLSRAIKRLYSYDPEPEHSRFKSLLKRWSPYRSIACWVLWRWVDENFSATSPDNISE